LFWSVSPVRLYVPRRPDALSRVVAEYGAGFKADGNGPIVDQVVAAARRRRVIKLTSTYTSVAMKEVQAAAGCATMAAAERLIANMVSQ